MYCSSASEVATTATRWLDPVTGGTHEPEMRRSVSDNGPTGSDGVPSDTTEDDWSRGSAEDPDEVPSPSSSPSPSPAEPPDHTGPITELDRKVPSKRVPLSREISTTHPVRCVEIPFNFRRKSDEKNVISLGNPETKITRERSFRVAPGDA